MVGPAQPIPQHWPYNAAPPVVGAAVVGATVVGALVVGVAVVVGVYVGATVVGAVVVGATVVGAGVPTSLTVILALPELKYPSVATIW